MSSRNRWGIDGAARVGVAVDRALIYGKVGVATGRFDFSSSFAQNDGSFISFQSGSSTLTGVVLGAGIEYAFATNWSAKLEYDRTDYLARSVSFVSVDNLGDVNFSNSNETATTNIVKAGINYRFFAGGPGVVVAKY
jgi:outer membrane immunogenic protein